MQSRQPLQVSDWMTTVSNSVRMMAPGRADLQAGRLDAVLADVAHHQPAAACSRSSLNCSMNLTCRQWMPSSRRVLS